MVQGPAHLYGPQSNAVHAHQGTPVQFTEPYKRLDSPSGTPGALYNPRATIIIIGMKGAGKTTLGLIANRTLGRTFIDTDHLFRTSENASVESFVAAHGWNAFRSRETTILKDLLARYPYDTVIACGGGIVESSESRRLLKDARPAFPIIRVLREDDAIRRYIDGRWLRQYDEDLDAMMVRRASLDRECCSHTFFNLTCPDPRPSSGGDFNGPPAQVHPLKFKQVGDSFLRLLRAVLGEPHKASPRSVRAGSASVNSPVIPSSSSASAPARNSISHLLASHGPGPDRSPDWRASARLNDSPSNRSAARLANDCAVLPRRANVLDRSSLLTRRTTAMSLTFADLTVIDPAMIQQITQGVDALELRVDMLDCMRSATATARASQPEREPLVNYEEVARQLETLRKLAPEMPILFTLRSDREGGFFHDDRKLSQRDTASPHSQAIYFKLLELAIGTGVELLDVELGWDPWMTKKLIGARGRTRIVPSYHDLMGALKWDGNVPHQLYERACSFGNGVHVVMMIGTTTRSNLEQNMHIGSFCARVLAAAAGDPTRRMPPLMALNMGLAGRASRPFNDVLNFVSHPAMPIKAGRGQVSLKEMMEMLVRLSAIQTSHFHLYGAIHEEARLAKKAIQSAFHEFGLPYTLLDEGTWSISEYVTVHQRDDIPERDDEAALINSMSDGLFVAGHASRQAELYDIMARRCPQRMTLIARVVQAVDVMARQDMGLVLLGTERGRHVPNSLGEMRGPLVGCHTLPAAIFRVMSAHLAPINAPSAHRGGLVVILNDGDDFDAQASTRIAKRAAVFALTKMGFGNIYILEEAMHHIRSNEPLSRRTSVTPMGSRETSMPPSDQEQWSQEVLQLAQQSPARVLQDSSDMDQPEVGPVDEMQEILPRPLVKHISLRSLSQPTTGHQTTEQAIAHRLEHGSGVEASFHSAAHHDDEDPQTIATMHDFERNPSKRPCAIVIVGGTEAQQEATMGLLWDESHHVQPKVQHGEGDSNQAFMLPKEVWESYFGGTILRIPSKRSSPIGMRDTSKSRTSARVSDQTHDGTDWERGGWIHVKPWVLDRDRVQRSVVEAWTRRSAPSHHMSSVWDGKSA